MRNCFAGWFRVLSMERILLVSYEYPQGDGSCGGGGRAVSTLESELKDREYNVDVFTEPSGGHYATFPIRTYSDLATKIQKFDPDVVHGCFSVPSSLALPRLTQRSDTPFVCSVMGADIHDPTRFQIFRPVIRVANEHVLSAAQRVTAPSVDMARRVEDRFGIDTAIVPYGIKTENWEWRPRPQPSKINILTVCRPVPRKNLETAFAALRRAREHHGIALDWRIVGDSDQRLWYEKRFGDRDWVDFRGYVENIQAEYNWGDVFFLPSHHEAFGLVFLEAIACGLPIVTSSSGGQNDIVTNGVGITSAGTQPKPYAWAIKMLQNDYETYQRATEGHVQTKFSASSMAAEYIKQYDAVLA